MSTYMQILKKIGIGTGIIILTGGIGLIGLAIGGIGAYLGFAIGAGLGIIGYSIYRYSQRNPLNNQMLNQQEQSELIKKLEQQFKKLQNLNQEKIKKIQQKYKKLRKQNLQIEYLMQSLIKQQIQIVQQLYGKEYQLLYKKLLGSEKNVIFIGNTSAGKSKLLNKLFGLNQKTGIGETSMQFKCVHQIDNKINIFDSIGFHDQSSENVVNYRKQLAQINHCHLVFILFHGSMKSLKNLVEIICKSKQRMYQIAFVFTKCDLIDPQEQSITEFIEKQRNYLKTLGIENAQKYQFFMSSAKSDIFEAGQNQNYKIIKMINELQNA